MNEFQFFDPAQDFGVAYRKLPHWSQDGTLAFITWRTGDSLPQSLREELTSNRNELLRAAGLDPHGDWRAALDKLPVSERSRLKSALFQQWDELLDRGAGACVLARSDLADIVAKSFMHFDGQRYCLTDFVVMPNHVHILAAFADGASMSAQCESWKRFTSCQINKQLNQRGEFWQVEQFDHLVRSGEQFEYLRRYIADNGKNAGLRADQYRWYSKLLT